MGCLNGLQIRQDCLEKPVLDALAKALSPEEIEEGIAQAHACSTGSQNDAAARRTAILEELKVISAGEKRLLGSRRRTLGGLCSRANYPASLSLWISRAALINCASMRRISGA